MLQNIDISNDYKGIVQKNLSKVARLGWKILFFYWIRHELEIIAQGSSHCDFNCDTANPTIDGGEKSAEM